jgi:hypothetical protein
VTFLAASASRFLNDLDHKLVFKTSDVDRCSVIAEHSSRGRELNAA